MKNFYYLKSNQMYKVGVTVAAAIFVAGCANTPATSALAPTEQMAVSRAALNNANSNGGNEFAPIQFKSATEKMGAAELAMEKKNYVLARQLAEQAQVDADLAGAAARSVKAQRDADAVQEGNRVLRKEIDRKTN